MHKRNYGNLALIIVAVLVVAFFASAVRITGDPAGDGAARKSSCCCPFPAAVKNDTTKE